MQLSEVIREPGFAIRLNELIAKVALLKHASEVTQVLLEFVRLLKCNGAVFASFARDDDSFQTHNYFVACDAYWCNRYIKERWYMNDPALVYANVHSEPIAGDDLHFRTGGQRKFREEAREARFRSIAIVPAHSAAGRTRMGVLYLTSADETFFTAQTIPLAKMYLRAIAAEMLDWWMNKVRSQLLQQVAATPNELNLLRLTHLGHSTKEIARLVDMKPSVLDQKFSRLAMRFNVSGRVAAAQLAFENGLWDNT